MGFIELFIIALGLSMDAFAVSVCKGLSLKKINWKSIVTVALYFGIFQGLMPLIGYFLGVSFEGFITSVDHWIAFILLTLIGINMIRESRTCDVNALDDSLSFKNMIVLAIATSIDALAIGITFAFLHVNIVLSSLMIGIITFIVSAIGVGLGNKFGMKYKSKAEVFGGIVLILMGLKILLEHLNILVF